MIRYDVGDGEIPRARVRKGLMEPPSERIPDFSDEKHEKLIMKINHPVRRLTIKRLRNFEQNNSNNHVDLNDDRFVLNDETVLANLKLPKRRKISSKIKRTAGEKAMCSDMKANVAKKSEASKARHKKKQLKTSTPNDTDRPKEIPELSLDTAPTSSQHEVSNNSNLTYEGIMSDLEPLNFQKDNDESLDLDHLKALDLF